MADALWGLTGTPVFAITLTLLAYQTARWLQFRAGGNPVVNPVLVSIALVAAVLLVADIPYERYFEGARFIHLLLGPATVALAVPMHRQLPRIKEVAVPLLTALVVGSVTVIVLVILVARALGADAVTVASLAPKSATTPVSMAISENVGGVPSLTAVATILTGIVGAIIGPAVARLAGGREERVIGTAVGTISHGIGTARTLQIGEEAAAFAGLSFALNAVLTSVLVPVLLNLLG